MKRKYKYIISFFLCAFTATLLGSTENQGKIVRSFQVNKGGNLEVNILSGSGNVIVETWDKNEVSVYVKGFYEEDDSEHLKIYKSGSTIIVDDGGWASDGEAEFIIRIPSKFNVALKTNSGNLVTQGFVEGEVTAVTYGGDIRIGNVKGKVDLNTSGGNITTGELDGMVEINTYGGDIIINSITRDAQVSTSGGDIKIGDVGNYVKANTNGGDIHIDNIGGSADLLTYGGDVVIKNISGNANLKTYGGDIILTGASGFIQTKTGGGDIKLRKLKGSVEAKTDAGDIYVELSPTGKRGSKLTAGYGNITLLIPDNAKADIEAKILVPGGWDNDENNFEIRSEFKSQSYERDTRKDFIKARYLINGGGGKIILETSNSDIEIKKLLK
jgi:hypothetical protein